MIAETATAYSELYIEGTCYKLNTLFETFDIQENFVLNPTTFRHISFNHLLQYQINDKIANEPNCGIFLNKPLFTYNERTIYPYPGIINEYLADFSIIADPQYLEPGKYQIEPHFYKYFTGLNLNH